MNRYYLECFDMFIVLGECRKKYRQAANTYTECYPNRERKLHMVFKWLMERFIAYCEGKEKNMKKSSY